MQHLTLTRPIVFLDLETTGLNTTADRIVEISMVKVHPDGRREALTRRVNPGIPIPPEVTQVHGIADADVADAPPLAAIAAEVLAFIGEADLAGFNVQRFDLPVLLRELGQAGLRLEAGGRAVVDAQTIFHRMEPRDLTAAYRFYCGKELVEPHSARADVEAVVEILDAQLATYPDLPRSPQALAEQFAQREPAAVDPGGRLVWKNGEVAFNFGKHRGRLLRQVAAEDPDYLRWILAGDFDPAVKTIAQAALEGRYQERTPLGLTYGPPMPGSPGGSGAPGA